MHTLWFAKQNCPQWNCQLVTLNHLMNEASRIKKTVKKSWKKIPFCLVINHFNFTRNIASNLIMKTQQFHTFWLSTNPFSQENLRSLFWKKSCKCNCWQLWFDEEKVRKKWVCTHHLHLRGYWVFIQRLHIKWNNLLHYSNSRLVGIVGCWRCYPTHKKSRFFPIIRRTVAI